MVAATVIVGQLCWLLVRLHVRATALPQRQGSSLGDWSARQLELWSRRLSPVGRPVFAAAFVALPLLCILANGGAVLTNGGPLYLPAFASRFAAGAWCLWTILVTPAAARIPLWSSLVVGTLVVLQLRESPVSFLFLFAVAVLLYADALWLVLGGGGHPGPAEGGQTALPRPPDVPGWSIAPFATCAAAPVCSTQGGQADPTPVLSNDCRGEIARESRNAGHLARPD